MSDPYLYDPFADSGDGVDPFSADTVLDEVEPEDDEPLKSLGLDEAVVAPDRYDATGSCTLGEEMGKCDRIIFTRGTVITNSLIGKHATEQVCTACSRRGVRVDWYFTGISRILVKCHHEEDPSNALKVWKEELKRYLIAFKAENERAARKYHQRLVSVKATFSEPESYPGFPSAPETRYLDDRKAS